VNDSATAAAAGTSGRNARWMTSGSALVTLIALFKFALEMHAPRHYGIFRDEMDSLACGRHLAWGYVDQPPLWPFMGWILIHTIGTSLLALRLIPALCGVDLVLLTGAVARRMGGGCMAQALAIVTAPIYMLMQGAGHRVQALCRSELFSHQTRLPATGHRLPAPQSFSGSMAIFVSPAAFFSQYFFTQASKVRPAALSRPVKARAAMSA